LKKSRFVKILVLRHVYLFWNVTLNRHDQRINKKLGGVFVI